MKPPPIRLAFGPFFWRAFVLVALIAEIGLWRRIHRFRRRRRPGLVLIYMLYRTPERLFVAFAIAAAATVLIDLYVRTVMRVLIARWYSPKRPEFGLPLEFGLDRGETILHEAPARRLEGRKSRPGSIVMTDRRLWFAPSAWDAPGWTAPLDQLASVRRIPAPRRFGSSVLGIPDRLAFEGPGLDGATLLVADPDELLGWFSDRIDGETRAELPSDDA